MASHPLLASCFSCSACHAPSASPCLRSGVSQRCVPRASVGPCAATAASSWACYRRLSEEVAFFADVLGPKRGKKWVSNCEEEGESAERAGEVRRDNGLASLHKQLLKRSFENALPQLVLQGAVATRREASLAKSSWPETERGQLSTLSWDCNLKETWNLLVKKEIRHRERGDN